MRIKWETWGEGVRLVVLDSPYRLLIEPCLTYIQQIIAIRQPNEIIYHRRAPVRAEALVGQRLHAQTAFMLRMALLFKRGIVITEVPYQSTRPWQGHPVTDHSSSRSGRWPPGRRPDRVRRMRTRRRPDARRIELRHGHPLPTRDHGPRLTNAVTNGTTACDRIGPSFVGLRETLLNTSRKPTPRFPESLTKRMPSRILRATGR